jgi:hypothetical protein
MVTWCMVDGSDLCRGTCVCYYSACAWGLSTSSCGIFLGYLWEQKFLYITRDGAMGMDLASAGLLFPSASVAVRAAFDPGYSGLFTCPFMSKPFVACRYAAFACDLTSLRRVRHRREPPSSALLLGQGFHDWQAACILCGHPYLPVHCPIYFRLRNRNSSLRRHVCGRAAEGLWHQRMTGRRTRTESKKGSVGNAVQDRWSPPLDTVCPRLCAVPNAFQ